jgi:hypothetical protein
MIQSSDIKKYSSSDYFFYYGKVDVADECLSDLYQIVFQASRSLYFYRNFGAGISDYENYPNALMLQIMIPYSIAEAVSERNGRVSDGSNGTVDRRIALSQDSIEVIQEGMNITVNVQYFLYMDYSTSTITLPLGSVKNV